MSSSQENLHALLQSLFTSDSFRIWLTYGPDGPQLAALLPGPTATHQRVIAEGVDVLIRHGHINRRFFLRLAKDFAQRGEEIRRTAHLFGVRLSAATKQKSLVGAKTDDPPEPAEGPAPITLIVYNDDFALHRRVAISPAATTGELSKRVRSIIEGRQPRSSPFRFDFKLVLSHAGSELKLNAKLAELGIEDGHSVHVHITAKPRIGAVVWEPKSLSFSELASAELAQQAFTARLFELLKDDDQAP